MKVLVTGATGRLGRQTVNALFHAGMQVVATDVQYQTGLPVRLELADLLDEHAAYRLLDGCDALVHLANHPNLSRRIAAQRTYGENTAMTANVVYAAADLGVRRIVYASSIQALCGSRRVADTRPSTLAYLPMDGDLPRNPGNAYALSKVAGEELLQLLATGRPEMSVTAIRFPALWEEEWLAQYVQGHARKGWWANDDAHADEGFTWLRTTDAARLVRDVVQRGRPGYRQYLPAARANSLRQPAAEVMARYYPTVPWRGGAERDSLVDTSMITRDVGWEPTPDPEPQPTVELASPATV